MNKLYLALDQGTTSSRAVLFDAQGRMLASHGVEFAQRYPKAGWVEHDPADILRSQTEALRAVLEKAGAAVSRIAAVGVTNQRETAIIWDRATGEPIHNAVVWQCRRSAELCARLKREGLEPLIMETTGLVSDAYFSASKIAWLLENVAGVRERAERGELCFGTVDTFLAWHLCQDHPHVTDPSNASRTMLMNLRTLEWDEDMLRLFNVPRAILPRIADTSGFIGALKPDFLGRSVPVLALAGDQQAALFGQACFGVGIAKNTYGTGCFALMNTGSAPSASKNRMLSTLAWRISAEVCYALEGSVFIAGAAIQWLRDEMKLISTAAESETLAATVPDTGGVMLVPAFTGLGAPYWDADARGTLVGITRGTNRAHIVRAALEAIAHQSADVLAAMEADSGIHLSELRVDGGASQNNLLMQFQADILGCAVLRPQVAETTALGAAMLAAVAEGGLTKADVARNWAAHAAFEPRMPVDEVAARRTSWKRAVLRAMRW